MHCVPAFASYPSLFAPRTDGSQAPPSSELDCKSFSHVPCSSQSALFAKMEEAPQGIQCMPLMSRTCMYFAWPYARALKLSTRKPRDFESERTKRYCITAEFEVFCNAQSTLSVGDMINFLLRRHQHPPFTTRSTPDASNQTC